MTPLLVNFDPLLELVYNWPLYEVIFDYLFKCEMVKLEHEVQI